MYIYVQKVRKRKGASERERELEREGKFDKSTNTKKKNFDKPNSEKKFVYNFLSSFATFKYFLNGYFFSSRQYSLLRQPLSFAGVLISVDVAFTVENNRKINSQTCGHKR